MRGFKTDIALIQVAILHEPSKFLKEMLNLQIQNLPNRCRPKQVKHQITNIFGVPRLYNFAFVSPLKVKAEKKNTQKYKISPRLRFPIFPHCALRTWCGLLDG